MDFGTMEAAQAHADCGRGETKQHCLPKRVPTLLDRVPTSLTLQDISIGGEQGLGGRDAEET